MKAASLMTNPPSSEAPQSPPLLASTSPRRKELLRRLLAVFDCSPPDVTEIINPHAAPGALALINARAKALACSKKHPGRLIIAADTVVHLAGQNLGKPASLPEAKHMLRALSGRTHWVFTAVCLARGAGCRANPHTVLEEWVEQARVRFHPLNEPALEAILSRSNPLDKAGAYALQDDDGTLVAAVEGEPETVIGLPLIRLRAALLRHAPEACLPHPSPEAALPCP